MLEIQYTRIFIGRHAHTNFINIFKLNYAWNDKQKA